MGKSLPDLSDLSKPGTRFRVRATPGARTAGVEREGPDLLRVKVTTVAEKGKANAAILTVLAKAIGVPKSRLTVLRGDTGRDKLVQVDD